ncbi:hypothetical protein [Desertimonas flava]|uniref:hypothetical protein n=1 Tax=Desertimonas flava TaxID=2064846 RepID=UPI000E34D5EB|nr:hypothetical protein [Desertimonas flava]
MSGPFTFDLFAARFDLEALGVDEMPTWDESPARMIEQTFYDVAVEAGHLAGPDGWSILLYPLIYDSDPDGLLVTVVRPNPLPALAGNPSDWDDWLPKDSSARSLSVDETIDLVQRLVDEANRLVADSGLARVAAVMDESAFDGDGWNGGDVCGDLAVMLTKSGYFVDCAEHGEYCGLVKPGCPLCTGDQEEDEDDDR